MKPCAIAFAALFVSANACIVHAEEALFKELDAANQAFAKAILAKDIEHLVNDYTDDACVIAPQSPKACGKDAIRSFWSGLANSGVKDVQIETVAVGSSGELAYATGTLEVTDAENTKHLSRFVLVLKNINGVWKLYLDTWTPA